MGQQLHPEIHLRTQTTWLYRHTHTLNRRYIDFDSPPPPLLLDRPKIQNRLTTLCCRQFKIHFPQKKTLTNIYQIVCQSMVVVHENRPAITISSHHHCRFLYIPPSRLPPNPPDVFRREIESGRARFSRRHNIMRKLVPHTQSTICMRTKGFPKSVFAKSVQVSECGWLPLDHWAEGPEILGVCVCVRITEHTAKTEDTSEGHIERHWASDVLMRTQSTLLCVCVFFVKESRINTSAPKNKSPKKYKAIC